MTNDGVIKDDAGKQRVDLVPPEAILGAAEAFAYGAAKYGERNWEGGFSYGRLYAALLRHLFAWWMGEERDEESGLHHLSHAMSCLMMLFSTVNRNDPNLDDRYKIEPEEENPIFPSAGPVTGGAVMYASDDAATLS